MTKSHRAKFYNISFAEDFLAVLSNHLLDEGFDYNDLVVLPTQRACRKLERYFFDNRKENLFTLPQLTTFADLVKNPYLILESCTDLDINPVSVVSSHSLYFIISKILKELGLANSLVNDVISFANKFYTFADDANKLSESVEKKLLLALEAELKNRELVLETQARKIMSARISNALEISNQKIHLICPVEKIPYTRQMIKKFGKLQNTSIYFQGLDQELSTEIWQGLDESHPQVAFKDLLEDLELDRKDIVNINPVQNSALVRELFAPNNQIHLWREKDISINSVTAITCESEHQEITIISYIIREYIDKDCRSIGVISDDKFFNKKLKKQLYQWNIAANDTTAESLVDSLSANVFLLYAELLIEPSPIKYLEVLKHPLSILKSNDWFALESKYLRKPQANFDSVADFPEIQEWVQDLKSLTGKSFDEKLKSLLALVCKYSNLEIDFIEFVQSLQNASENNFISDEDFLRTLTNLIAMQRVPSEEVLSDVVTITSFLEARLLNFDLVIIPQLNHPFPVKNSSRFYISQSEEKALGLPSEVSVMGNVHFDMSSHIHKKCFLMRSEKLAGETKIPAQIFEKFLTLSRVKSQHFEVEKYFQWYSAIHLDNKTLPASQPMPTPKRRPDSISVSGIEKLMENPYGYYARYILGLKKLEDLDPLLSNREFGTAIHSTINIADYDVSKENFISHFKTEFVKELGSFANSIIAKNFWLPRVDKIASWIWEYETENLAQIKEISKEYKLRYKFADVMVSAIADRIEILNNGAIKIIDYKTGNAPAKSDVETGIFPQLPIEGLIISKMQRIGQITGEYHELKAKKDNACIKYIDLDLGVCEAELLQLIGKFLVGEDAFFATQKEELSLSKTRDYFHLSRIKEWLD